jgi:hypothetical protein
MVMLAVLIVTILWFAAYAPDTVPSHIGADGTIDGEASKSGTLFVVVPVSLLICVGLAFRPLWKSLPLRRCPMPLTFNSGFWIAEGRSDYLRRQMLDYLSLLSGLGSGVITSGLWMSWLVSTGHTVPPSIPTIEFWTLVIPVVAATVWHYRRLRPSEWSPADDESE